MSKSPVVANIRELAARLVAEVGALREQNRRLAAQHDKLQTGNRDQQERIAVLERRIAVLEMREAVTGGGDEVKVARARVNRLMREVDKCIALLNK